MQRCSLLSLSQLTNPVSLFIHSNEGSIYTATCELENAELAVVYNDDETPLMTRSLQKMHEHFRLIPFKEAHLMQRSAYDEMIGTQTVSEPMTMKLEW